MARRDRVPAVKVSLGEAELPKEAYADLLDVRVQQDIDASWMFSLRFLTWDPGKLALSWVDDHRFAPAAPVSVEMGYLGALVEVMKGEITALELDLASRQTPVLTVRGYDRSHRMRRVQKTRAFEQKSDSQIAEEIAREHRLTPKVERTAIEHESLVQYNQTDLEFLRQRAALNAYEVVVERDILHFRRRQDAGSPVLKLSAERDLLSVSVRLSVSDIVDTVEVRAWDQKKKEPITGKAVSTQLTPMGGVLGPSQAGKLGSARAVVQDLAGVTQEEADQAARAVLEMMAREFVTGDGECLGRADIQAGATVTIDGIGDRFSGPYDVVSATHTYSPRQGYHTSFSVKRNST